MGSAISKTADETPLDPHATKKAISAAAFRNYFGLSRPDQPGLAATSQLDAIERHDYTDKLDISTESSGGSDDLLQATISRTQKKVAVKVLRAVNDNIKMAQRKRLARELYVWMGLNHPNVLPMYGFAFVQGNAALVSPWCKNGDVKQYLHKHPEANRKAMVRQCAEGLLYLHKSGIVHSNLNPHNVVVNDGGAVMICDFGLAKDSSGARGFTTTNQNNAYSLRYASAERCDGSTPTAKADVYSFGGLAYELLTDKLPFADCEHAGAVIMATAMGKMPAIPGDYVAVTKGDKIWRLLKRCWVKEPVRRPSMVTVVKELQVIGYQE